MTAQIMCKQDCQHATTYPVSSLPFYHPYSHFCGTSNYVNALLLSAICVSVCPSVTLVIHAQMVRDIEMSFALSNRAMLDARFLSSSKDSCLLLAWSLCMFAYILY